MDSNYADAESGGASVTLDWEESEAGAEDDPSGRATAGHDLIVVGHGNIVKQHKGSLVAPESTISAADVDSLGRAVRDQRRCCSELPELIFIAPGNPDPFDEELFEADPVHLEVDEDHVHACVGVLIPRRAAQVEEYRGWLDGAARANGCDIVSVRLTDQYGREPEDIAWPVELAEDREQYLAAERARPRVVEVRIAPTGPMTVACLLAAGRDVHTVLIALRGGPMDATAATHLLRAGLPHLLLGLAENEWLEVKRQPYDFDAPGSASDAAKIELAQDVARFANGDVAAVLVIGLESKKHEGVDVIQAVRPASLSALSPERYRSVIDQRVYPAVEGLRIDQVDMGDGKGLLVVGVPDQPGEYKPFLVHGAIVGERVEGAFISIVRRRGEGSTTLTASQVHAMIAAGRALLRGNAE